MFPICPAAAKTPRPSAGPRQAGSANQAGLWHSDCSGSLRGLSNMETLEVAPAVHPRSRSQFGGRTPNLVAEPHQLLSRCQDLLQVTVLWTGRSSGYPWLHVSNNVNEYSTVLGSLAGEGSLAPFSSLDGPPVREIPGEKELPSLQWVNLWE